MIRTCRSSGVASFSVGRVSGSASARDTDELSVEEPLEIRLAAHDQNAAVTSVAVTMRTPGGDTELAAGFLFTEGIISGPGDLKCIEQMAPNAVLVRLRPGLSVDPS